MTDAQWKRVWDLYEEAYALSPDEARSLLDRVSDDPEIVGEVHAILAASEGESSLSTEEEPPQWPHLGEKIGRYEVVAPLGRGGTGEVYVGRDTVLGRPVALKFIVAEHAGAESISKRFFREAQAASALNHPNIVTVHEVAMSGSSPVIVMELVEGAPLRKLCGQPLPEQQAMRIGAQIALALAAAHSRGIVHRDLKPENVMVRPDGYIKVLDFGLARNFAPSAASGDVSSTAGLPVGTLRYMSPEQCKGEPATPASDVFSFGLVLYEMCAGVHPFKGDSPLDIAHSIVWSEPQPPAAVWRGMPESLRKLILSMLAKDPLQRPSADEVSRKLGGLPASQPEMATAPSHPPLVPVKLRVSRRWIVGGAAAVGAAALGARFWPRQDRWHPGVLIGQGNACDPAFSPDGSRLACSWKPPSSDNFHIFLISAAGGDPVQLTRSNSEEVGAAWSPDGTQLSFIRQGAGEDAVYVIPVDSGKEQRIVTVSPNPFISRVDWLSNRALVVSDEFGSETRRLVRIDLETGQRRQLTAPPERAADIAPRQSPDGKTLLFCRVFALVATDLFVVSAEGGEPRRLTFDELPKREIRWTPDGRGILFRAPQKQESALWYMGLDGRQPAQAVLPLRSLLAQFDVRPGNSGGLVVALASSYATEAIWRADRPTAAGNFSDPVQFISSARGGVDVNPVISPDGLRVAFVSLRSGSPQIWVADNEGKSAKQLTTLQGGVQVTVPAWSPDSREIVAAARGTGVFVLDAAENASPRVLHPEGTEPQFSADGQSITFNSHRGGKPNLWRIPAAGGAARQLTRDGGNVHRASRDGRWIYLVRREQPGLWRIPAQGGKGELVLDRLRSELYRGWALGRNGIYYTDYDAAARQWMILLYDPERGTHQPVCRFGMPLTTWTGTLSVSPDERWMVFPLRQPEGGGLSVLPEIHLERSPAKARA